MPDPYAVAAYRRARRAAVKKSDNSNWKTPT